jgi:hypothetical protein
MNKPQISLTINRAYLESISIIWNALINELRTVEGFQIDDEMVSRLNAWNENANTHWPVFGNRYSHTPAGLVSYKGYPLTMRMTLSDGWQYCTINMDQCSTYALGEAVCYHGNYYGSGLDTALNILHTNELVSGENSGKPLNKVDVLKHFSQRREKRHANSIAWYLSSSPLEWLIEQLDKRIDLIVKSKKAVNFTKQEEKIYNRYLKNRWPKVDAYLKALPKK